MTAVSAFCHFGEHDKCDREGSGVVYTTGGKRPCGCTHHDEDSSPSVTDTRSVATPVTDGHTRSSWSLESGQL